MWELDCKKDWMLKNWCFQIVGLEKTLESPREDCKEIKPVNPKENQPWIFFGRKVMTNLDSDITLPTSTHIVKAMVFPVIMHGCESWNHKEGWAPKNWCAQTVVLEKTAESPLDCKESKPVNPKGNLPWISIGRTNAEAEAPTLWPPDVKSRLTEKDPDAGNWRQKENGTAEDEMVR